MIKSTFPIIFHLFVLIFFFEVTSKLHCDGSFSRTSSPKTYVIYGNCSHIKKCDFIFLLCFQIVFFVWKIKFCLLQKKKENNVRQWRKLRRFPTVCQLISDNFSTIYSSVVDPNTLILDPDPGFRPNLDPDQGPNPIRTNCHLKKFLMR